MGCKHYYIVSYKRKHIICARCDRLVTKSEPSALGKTTHYGRGRRTRTLNKGFGDPRVTITPCPFGTRMQV